MADLLTLEVATPIGLALRTDAQSVAAPSVNGEFGVFPGHLPLLAAVKPGLLKYRAANRDHVAAVGAGFVEVGPSKVLVLTDQYVAAKDVNESETKAELADAEKALVAYKELHEGREYDELQRRIDWCNARLAARAAER